MFSLGKGEERGRGRPLRPRGLGGPSALQPCQSRPPRSPPAMSHVSMLMGGPHARGCRLLATSCNMRALNYAGPTPSAAGTGPRSRWLAGRAHARTISVTDRRSRGQGCSPIHNSIHSLTYGSSCACKRLVELEGPFPHKVFPIFYDPLSFPQNVRLQFPADLTPCLRARTARSGERGDVDATAWWQGDAEAGQPAAAAGWRDGRRHQGRGAGRRRRF